MKFVLICLEAVHLMLRLLLVVAVMATVAGAEPKEQPKYRVTHYPPGKGAAKVWVTDKVPTWHYTKTPDGKWERTGYVQFYAMPGKLFVLVKPDLIETVPATRVIGRERNTWRRRL